jgi:hypothetical protein
MFNLNSTIMKKFQLITAICAAFSGLMFGLLCLHYYVERHDLMIIPFAIIGFVGALVMWANRK